MPRSQTVDDVRDLVGPLVDAAGCRLYDIELSGSGRAPTLRVLIDRDGGVDLDAITDVTRSISGALDDSDAVGGPFLLEVSSPGLERPLRREEHFRGAIGETVSMTFHTETGPRRVRGELVEAGSDTCIVATEGERVVVPYDALTKARTVFEWGRPQPARGKKTKGVGK
jgi:ribosome maturation factor RimP